MRSIKAFLLLGLGAILLLSFGVIFFVNHFLTEREVNELYDTQLVQTSRIFEGFLDRPASEVDFDHINHALAGAAQQYAQRGERISQGHEYEHKFAIQLWDAERNLLIKSPSAPLYSISPFHNGYSISSFDGHQWRVYTHAVAVNGYWVVVGERDDVRGDMADNIEFAAIAGPVIAMLILAMGVIIVVVLALRPLNQASDQIKERHINRLEPLGLSALPTELKPLLESLNYLMSRIESEVDRERQFLGNVAHELRTPLAALKLNAQLGLKTQELSAAHLSLEKVEKGVNRANRMVEQLLLMARLEPAALGKPELVSLRDIFSEVYSQLEPQIQAHQLILEENWSDPDIVLGHPALLMVLFRNLLENTTRYCQQGVVVNISIYKNECGFLTLAFNDNGPGVSADQLHSLGLRFFREKPADRQGSGLGLSIVSRIAEIHNAQVNFVNLMPHGLGVKFIFPPL